MLEKQAIKRIQKKAREFTQITVDDDYIVKDQKPDVMKIIHTKGELCFDEVKPSGQMVWVSGKLNFSVLYRCEGEEGLPESLCGSVAIREKVLLDGDWEETPIHLQGKLEDLSIGIINSRKLSVRAVIDLEIVGEEILEEEVVCRLDAGEQMEEKYAQKEIMNLICTKRDVLRIHNEVSLPNSKDNIREIKYSQIDVRNLESEISNGKIKVQGEAWVCAIYLGEEKKTECYENAIPFSGELELDCLAEPDIYWIKAHATDCEVEARNDYDEESRILGVELCLDVEYKLWQEEKITLLEDAYALDREVTLVRQEGILPVFGIKNTAKVRVADSFRIEKEDEKILQLCFSTAEASVDQVEPVSGGLRFEGILQVHLIYLAAEDEFPLVHTQVAIPFEQTVEIMRDAENICYDYEVWVDRIQVNLMDNREYEVKGTISIGVLVWEDECYERITDVTQKESQNASSQLPGIVGYCAQEEQCLWDIAKKYHTTVEDIQTTNGIMENTIPANTKIIIVKKGAKW